MPSNPDLTIDLAGQVAIVTGASSGLGRRFATVLAANGAAVAAVARRADRLQAVIDDIRDAGGTAMPFVLDITDDSAFQTALDDVERTLGNVTILVNNAGIGDGRRVIEQSIADIDKLLDTNVRAALLLSVAVGRRWIERGVPGRIVNVSSMSGFHNRGHGGAIYSISKAALNRATEVLAVEWAPHHINVNGIAPGAFRTEMLDADPERASAMEMSAPRQRLGEVNQLDSTLLYLVSPISDAVTGTTIKVDDGQVPR